MNEKRKAIEKVEEADLAITREVSAYRHEPVVQLLGKFGDLGDQPPMIALSIATIAAGGLRRDTRLARAGGRMLASHLLATWAKGMIKRHVDRTRPKVLVDEGRYTLGKGEHNEGKYNSFPSGHTAGAVAVARAFGREYPDGRPYAYGAAGVIAAIQIPRCNHFASDIVAGALIGWAAEALIDRAVSAVSPPS